MKKILNQQDMRDINLGSVFRLIRHAGPVTRRQIEGTLDLSWGAVSGATATLLREGYIKEVKAEVTAAAGRTPIALAVNPDDHFLLGLDVNRSGLSGVVINLRGGVLHRLTREATATTRDGWIDEIETLIRDLLCLTNGKTVEGIGIAMQGAVNGKEGISANFPATGWQNVPLAALLSDSIGYPVFLAHDPDCILYAASVERDLRDAVLLRVDQGIGMAVMLNGKVFERFGAFELGYTIAQNGKRLDDLITRRGLSQQSGLPFSELLKAARTGDTKATAFFSQMADALAAAIVNTAHLFHVEDFLLCGNMMEAQELFWGQLVSKTTEYAQGHALHIDKTEVEKAAVGAALLAAERITLQLQSN